MENKYFTKDEAIEISNLNIKKNAIKFAQKVVEKQKININKKEYVWV